MIANTKALVVLKTQIQEVYDFAVLISYAVPSIKTTISEIERGNNNARLPRPDYFRGVVSHTELREKSQGYKTNLCKYILLSSFSFFESYVTSIFSEIIEFHGGKEKFADLADQKSNKYIKSISSNILINKRKLQEYPKKGKEEKYKKHANILVNDNFRFPSELFASYGVRKFIEVSNDIKSFQIPEMLKHGLQLDLDAKTIEEFHNIRNYRNRIAHGDEVDLCEN